jgi:hypothetical protein
MGGSSYVVVGYGVPVSSLLRPGSGFRNLIDFERKRKAYSNKHKLCNWSDDKTETRPRWRLRHLVRFVQKNLKSPRHRARLSGIANSSAGDITLHFAKNEDDWQSSNYGMPEYVFAKYGFTDVDLDESPPIEVKRPGKKSRMIFKQLGRARTWVVSGTSW